MRTWARVVVPSTLCGGCNHELHTGDPVLMIDIAFLGGKMIHLWRCERCEGPAPPDLPALVERDTRITPRPMTKFHPTLPLGTPLADWRARQSGEREPGEEG